MFSKIREDIIKLNANVTDLVQQEKAKKLKKQLLLWGGIATAIGVIGVITCFILFATAGLDSFTEDGFSARIIVPFCLFVPMGVVAALGAVVLRLGFMILIGGEASKFVDKSVNTRCECGTTIKDNELFCPKCGKAVKKICSKCQTINDPKSKFCTKCGNELE